MLLELLPKYSIDLSYFFITKVLLLYVDKMDVKDAAEPRQEFTNLSTLFKIIKLTGSKVLLSLYWKRSWIFPFRQTDVLL